MKANDQDSGESLVDSFASYDPTSSSWRTSQASFLMDWDVFSETWPRSGTTRNGRAYARLTSVLRTVASAYSSLRGTRGEGETWLSPNTSPDSTSNHGVKEGIPSSGKSLAKQARGDWPTPDANPEAPNSSTNRGVSEQEEARNWPTPRAEDSESSGARLSRGTADTLTALTRQCDQGTAPPGAATPSQTSTGGQWPTPTANEDSYRLQGNSQQSKCLTAVLISPAGLPGPASPSTPGSPRASSVVLNPGFVESLMGFPVGWTDLLG